MECFYLQNLLSAYLDDELIPEEKRLVRKHLFSCEVCQQELESLKFTKLSLAQLNAMEVPVDFASRLKMELSANRRPHWSFSGLNWMAVAAVTFLFWIAPSFTAFRFEERFLTEEQILANNNLQKEQKQAGAYYSLTATPDVKKKDDTDEPVQVDTIIVNYPR